MYCNATVIFAGMQHKEFWYHLLEVSFIRQKRFS